MCLELKSQFTTQSKEECTALGTMGYLSESLYRVCPLVGLGQVQRSEDSHWFGLCQKAGLVLRLGISIHLICKEGELKREAKAIFGLKKNSTSWEKGLFSIF